MVGNLVIVGEFVNKKTTTVEIFDNILIPALGLSMILLHQVRTYNLSI